MTQALLEHIEAKIINFLHDAKAPVHASQIAVHIQEKRQDTVHAIQKLVRNNTLKGVQDFAFFNTTGETMAYTLVAGAAEPAPVDTSIPIPTPQPASPPSNRPTPGGSAYKSA